MKYGYAAMKCACHEFFGDPSQMRVITPHVASVNDATDCDNRCFNRDSSSCLMHVLSSAFTRVEELIRRRRAIRYAR
jgi:hypothetical protein